MPLELVLSPDRRYLSILAAGETALQELDTIIQPAVQACRAAAVTRVLVDARHVRGALSRLDLFKIASNLPMAGFLPGTRFALVIDLESPDIQYFEQVAISRGALIDHYLNYDEALDDLLAPEFG
jgi:hypothetical protein